ncbi:MAG: glycine zipper domain-containing protein, partial [Bacteroidota bacterium]
MEKAKTSIVWILAVALIISSCASMNKTQKGAVIGTASGAAMGAIIGDATGNPALGAIIGAAVGGATGAVIGNQMDKQAAEIEESIPDAKVVRVEEGIVVEFGNNILFGFDRSDLSEEAFVDMDKLIVVLDHYPDTNIEIQGHTDNTGTE